MILGWLLIIASHNGHFGKVVSVEQFKFKEDCESAKRIIENEKRWGLEVKCEEMKGPSK